MEVPAGLVRAIREGRCVAFVGAGFCQPLLPSWKALLEMMAAKVPSPHLRPDLLGWLSSQSLSNRDYEGIAQTIKQAFDEAGAESPSFEAALAETLNSSEARPGVSQEDFERHRALVLRRRALLKAIPFHSILTTNFDPILEGRPPSTQVFSEVIGARRRPWWSYRAWSAQAGEAESSWRAPVVKLHGDISAYPENDAKLVFTTRGYRRLIHTEPGYRAFLRTLFATHAVFYLGFSFSDAYINDLRSEIFALIGKERGGGLLNDYALLADVPDRVAHHLREHEGLECLTFSSRDRTDFSGFDRWLEAVHGETSPEYTLKARVRDKNILWFDPVPKNNEFGHGVLAGATGHNACVLDTATTVEQAVAALPAGYDLIISHFGYQGAQPPNVQRLVEAVHAQPLEARAPVVVFSEREHRALNRPLALRLGVYEYVHDWPGLFETIERLFDHGAGSSPEGSTP